MTTWKTEKTTLDHDLYEVELAPEGTLWLTNDQNKDELKLTAQGTYDLLLFLSEHAGTLYKATHQRRESGPDTYDGQIIVPTDNEGETTPPPEGILYADPTDPSIHSVWAIARDWAQDAHGEKLERVVRIAPVDSDEDQCEEQEVPAFLKPFASGMTFTGEPDESWKVTIWTRSGMQSTFPDHLYIHRSDDRLITGSSESGSAAPRTLLLPYEEDEDESVEEE